MVRPLSIVALLSVASLAAFAEVASAEEITLVSGRTYDASDIVVSESSVRFTYVAEGRAATIRVPVAWVKPESLYGLVQSRTGSTDAKAQLRLAHIAVAGGMESAAEARFREAAALDAKLAAESAAGLEQLKAKREAEAQALLAAAEDDLRHGRYAAAIVGAKAAAARAGETSLTAIRAAGLQDLAARLLGRDRVRLEAEAKAKADALAVAEAEARVKADALAAIEAAHRADEAAQEEQRVATLEMERLRQRIECLTNDLALARRRAACVPNTPAPCSPVPSAPPAATAPCAPFPPVRDRPGAGAAHEPSARGTWFDSRVPHPPPPSAPAPAPTPEVRPAPVEIPTNLTGTFYGFPNGSPAK